MNYGIGLILTATLALSTLTGCGDNFAATPAAVAGKSVGLSGNVHGGQQPVVGAKVYLYAVGNGGIGTASRSVITTTQGYAITDALGGFTLNATDYSCQAGDMVYLYATGGNPGYTDTTTNNAYLSLMLALGDCSALPTSFVRITEVTTVAAVYALAGFMTDGTHIASGSSAAALTGVRNAFATAANLADIGPGTARTTTMAGNGIVPAQTINTLADALSYCVNSTGLYGNSQPCGILSRAVGPGTVAQYDTVVDCMMIAQNPFYNAAAVYNAAPATAPFQPTLGSAPDAFVMPITYTGGGMYGPYDLDIDAAGNIWTVSDNNKNVLSELANDGTVLSPAAGYMDPSLDTPIGVRLDKTGNVIVSNYDGSSLSVFTPSGTLVTFVTGGGINNPSGLAIDSLGNVWVANGNNTVSAFKAATYAAISPAAGFTGNGGLTGLGYVAADQSGNIWFTEDNTVARFNTSGVENDVPGGFPACGSNLVSYGISIDGSGRPWVQCTGQNKVTTNGTAELSTTGSELSPVGGYPYQAESPVRNSIDSAGNVWMVDFSTARLLKLNSAGTLVSTTYSGGNANGVHGRLSYPNHVLPDSSGNLWIICETVATPLVEYVGVAAPTARPLYMGAAQP